MSSYMGVNGEAPELAAQRLINTKRNNKFITQDIDKVYDEDWLKQSFMILSGAVTPEERVNRVFTSANFKFQDSSIGGHYVINPRPQFTRYADTPVKGFLSQRNDMSSVGSHANVGMGHYYSEAIDDTSQVIHMRFGVPQFNSMTTFFTGFFDNRTATTARTGRMEASFFESLGSAVGMVTYLVTWPLLLASFVGNAIRFAMSKPTSSFYYFKPTMPAYWLAVNTMVNNLAVAKGMFPGELQAGDNQFTGTKYSIDTAAMAAISEMMPDVFTPTGGIDVHRIASRGQRIKNQLDKVLSEEYSRAGEGESSEVYQGVMNKLGFIQKYDGQQPTVLPGDRGFVENILNKVLNSKDPFGSLSDMIKKWSGSDAGKVNDPSKSVDFERSLKVGADGKESQYSDSFASYMSAELDDGSAFCSFRVNSTGPVNESFTNNIVDSDLASKFNSTSSSNKAAYFASAGGNIVGGNLIGDAVQTVTKAAADVVKGALDSLNIGGLLALGGSAFTVIPKNWEDSIATLPKSNYTINLVSPYGNVISQMTNIYIPLCMLLAGCLPLSAGRQAYTSPFLVQIFDRGRQQSRLGIIDSMSITRGTSNLGFNKDGNAMRIDVTFSVADLSPVMAMPIGNKTLLGNLAQAANPFDGIMDDDNVYTDYINVLASLGLYDQIYFSARLKIRIAQKMRRYEMFFNKARTAMFFRDLAPVSWLDIFFKGAQRDNRPNMRNGIFGDKEPF